MSNRGFAQASPQVSFDEESLILVDENDNVVGYESKLKTHRGSGLLHRAFSIFIFSGPDRVLLHRRSEQKLLWPGFWTNSCCSHPRHGESYAYAARRRLREELGVCTELAWLYQFQYSARFGDEGSEHELCAVMIGDIDEGRPVEPNRLEVLEWGWYDCSTVDGWIRQTPEQFTPWFKLEWARLRGDQLGEVEAFCRRRQQAHYPSIH
jgi:isopentenyl-diphosphate delta-isomerase